MCTVIFFKQIIFLCICIYVRCLPTFRMGKVLSGFLSANLSILKFSSILHTKVQSDKLSNYIIKPLMSDKVSVMSSVPISTSFRSPDSLTSLLIDKWPHIYSTHVHLDRFCLFTCFYVCVFSLDTYFWVFLVIPCFSLTSSVVTGQYYIGTSRTSTPSLTP